MFKGKPILQVGGLHDAVTEPDPGCDALSEQVPAAQVDGAEIEAGCAELHVNGALGTTQPWTSTAVALTDCKAPLLAVKLV
jgi:hypothetical protein